MLIYQNADSFVLTLILEEEKEEITGVVLELYKVFAAKGTDIELFVSSLRRNSLLFTKNTSQDQYKYFLLGTDPEFVPFTQNLFGDKVIDMVEQVDLFASTIADVSKGYDIDLTPIAEGSEDEKASFFAEPMFLPAISANVKGKKEETRQIETPNVYKTILLGLTKSGEKVEEPISIFSKTLISQGSYQNTIQAMHVMVESSLLSNVSSIVFDFDKVFKGLSKPTDNLIGLKKYKTGGEPVGFPVTEFDSSSIHINLNTLDPESFIELFGMGDSKEVQTLIQIWDSLKGEILSLKTLYDYIPEQKEQYGLNDYQVNRLIRLLKVIEERYPNVFMSANDIDEITRSSIAQLGRASLVDLSRYNYRVILCLLDSVLKEILQKYKAIGLSRATKFSVFMPKMEIVSPYNTPLKIQKDITNTLLDLPNYGVSIVLSCQKEIDISTDITKERFSRISIIKDNDVGIKTADKKPYRVMLRPGFSTMAFNYPLNQD